MLHATKSLRHILLRSTKYDVQQKFVCEHSVAIWSPRLPPPSPKHTCCNPTMITSLFGDRCSL